MHPCTVSRPHPSAYPQHSQGKEEQNSCRRLRDRLGDEALAAAGVERDDVDAEAQILDEIPERGPLRERQREQARLAWTDPVLGWGRAGRRESGHVERLARPR